MVRVGEGYDRTCWGLTRREIFQVGGIGALGRTLTGDIYVYNLREPKLVPLPVLNSAGHDCQPAISRDGRFIAFTSERVDAAGQRDIFLYDRRAAALLPTPNLNTPGEEFEPSSVVLDPALER